MTDSHCHLTDPKFSDDLGHVLRRARKSGVRRVVTVGTDVEDSIRAIDIARSNTGVHATAGLHPHEAGRWPERAGDLENVGRDEEVIAIGETGLDFFRDYAPRDAQAAAFAGQVRLARDLGKPLVLHVRDAFDETMRLLADSEAAEVGGVFHFFSGGPEQARRAVDAGFHVSVGGPITYKNAVQVQNVARTVPLNRLLVETDAPYAAPVPHRGKRCEPAHAAVVASRVAALRGITPIDAMHATAESARILFSLPRDPAFAYARGRTAYLNVTNRCSNHCSFCVSRKVEGIWGYLLRLSEEPTADDVVSALGDPAAYDEVVFCGFGEPTERFEIVLETARRIRGSARRIRLNTNGHGCLIAGRDVVPDVASVFDAVSVSLNAHDPETYVRLCSPRYGQSAYGAMLDFARACKGHGIETTLTVVDLPEVDVAECERVAEGMGVKLRVRAYRE